jgi:hypothetical protein
MRTTILPRTTNICVKADRIERTGKYLCRIGAMVLKSERGSTIWYKTADAAVSAGVRYLNSIGRVAVDEEGKAL